MRARLAGYATIAVAAVALATTAHAKPTVVKDAKGDARSQQAAHDIVSLTLDTARATKSATSPITTFTITMELAAAPAIQPGISYQLLGDLGDCGTLFVYSYWSALDQGPAHSFQVSSCGTDTSTTGGPAQLLDPAVKIEGNKISWTVSGKLMPKEFAKGYTMNDLYGFVAVTEPVVGYTTQDFSSIADLDSTIDTTAPTTYKYGS
jgi:hypothetical protein